MKNILLKRVLMLSAIATMSLGLPAKGNAQDEFIKSPSAAKTAGVLCDGCVAPPRPIDDADFSETGQGEQGELVKKYWEKYKSGSLPLEQEVLGEWKLVAKLGTTGRNFDGFSKYHLYNPKGIKNGSDNTMGLRFTKESAEGVNDGFLGDNNQPKTVLAAEFLNLSYGEPHNQGPNQVITSTEKKAMCYSLFGYSMSSGAVSIISKSVYFNHECRFVDQKKTKLLCAVRNVILNHNDVPEWQLALDGKIVAFFGYTRK